MNRWSLSSTLRKIPAMSRGSRRLQNPNQRNRSLESLERRCLLAGDLVANWQAQELAATLADGDTVTEWIDSVSGINATNGKGTPTFVAGQFSGRAAIRFDASDEIDQLVAAANTSPISGADDFSISVAFATSSDALAGTNGNWFDNTGIVDSNRQIFGRGWGLTMNSTGQLTTGLNSGAFGDSGMTVRSSESGLNDGGLHFATVTRSGVELAIYVDTNAPTVLSGGSDEARDPIELSIGALAGAKNGFTGDIAEVRIFNGALTADEVLGVHSDLESYYVNVPPVAADDTYTFNEDEGLFGFVQITTADGLLSNDTDTEADPLTAINVTQLLWALSRHSRMVRSRTILQRTSSEPKRSPIKHLMDKRPTSPR